MKFLKFLASILVLLSVITQKGYTQIGSGPIKGNVTCERVHYIKFAVFPFIYSELYQNSTWLIFHYEGRILESRLTYNLVVDYKNYVYKEYNNGVLVSQIPDNIEFWMRPHIRYYFSATPLNGFYGGVFPVFLYRNIRSTPIEGNYYGGGITVGYQKLLKKKFPVEVNLRISKQGGLVNGLDANGVPTKIHDSLLFGFIELNFGIATRVAK